MQHMSITIGRAVALLDRGTPQCYRVYGIEILNVSYSQQSEVHFELLVPHEFASTACMHEWNIK
jgi:hypothetical protein